MYKGLIFLLSTYCWAQTSVVQTADSLFILGNYNKAIKLYRQDSLAIYNQTKIAQSYVNQTAYTKAIPFYEKVIQQDSSLVLVRYELAKLYYKTKQTARAYNCFDALRLLDTENPNYHHYLGLCEQQARTKNDIKHFKKAVSLDEAHLKSIKQLCKHYLKKADWELFDIYIDKGLKHYSESQTLINYKAQACFNRQQYSKAIDYFERLYQVDPSNKFVVSKLGQSHHVLRVFDKALDYYKQALKLDKENGNVHTQIALLYRDKEEYMKAYMHYFTALRLNGVKLDVEHYNIAMLFKKQKKYEAAIKQFQLAIKENQYNHKAHFELAICADNFYKDNKEKLRLYKVYKLSFDGKEQRLDKIVTERMSYLKEKIHLASDTSTE